MRLRDCCSNSARSSGHTLQPLVGRPFSAWTGRYCRVMRHVGARSGHLGSGPALAARRDRPRRCRGRAKRVVPRTVAVPCRRPRCAGGGPIVPESAPWWAWTARRAPMPDNDGVTRLDQLLCERGLAETRSRAQALVMAGRVRVDGRLVTKAGTAIAADAALEVEQGPAYVSRGGDKLATALAAFAIDVVRARLPRRRRLDGRLHRLPPAARGGARRRRSTSAAGSCTSVCGPTTA